MLQICGVSDHACNKGSSSAVTMAPRTSLAAGVVERSVEPRRASMSRARAPMGCCGRHGGRCCDAAAHESTLSVLQYSEGRVSFLRWFGRRFSLENPLQTAVSCPAPREK